jgi:hypothetical protein
LTFIDKNLISNKLAYFEVKQIDVECAIRYLSRPDFDYIKYIDDNTKHNVCFKTTKLYNYPYCWNLTEIYYQILNYLIINFLLGIQ